MVDFNAGKTKSYILTNKKSLVCPNIKSKVFLLHWITLDIGSFPSSDIGSFPVEWKSARFCEGPQNADIRSIAIVSAKSKILEKTIQSEILRYLKKTQSNPR